MDGILMPLVDIMTLGDSMNEGEPAYWHGCQAGAEAQQSADLAIYQKREAEYEADKQRIHSRYADILAEKNAELRDFKAKEAEWLMANIFNKGLIDEPALATHIAELNK